VMPSGVGATATATERQAVRAGERPMDGLDGATHCVHAHAMYACGLVCPRHAVCFALCGALRRRNHSSHHHAVQDIIVSQAEAHFEVGCK